MPDPNIRVNYDASDAERAIQSVTQKLQQQNQQLRDFTVKTVEFNSAGQAQRAVIEQMDAAGRKIVSTYELQSNAATRLTTKIVENVKTQQLAAQTAQQVATGARQLFPAPDSASISSLLSYSNAISRVAQLAAQGNIPLATINQLMRRAATDARGFAANISTLPPELQKVAIAIAQLARDSDRAGQTAATAGQRFLVSFQGLSRIFIVQQFRRGIVAITNAMDRGIREALRYSVQLQQVANVTNQVGANFENLSARIRSVSERFAFTLGEVAPAAQRAFTSQIGDAAAGTQVLEASARLATATGINLAQATNLVTTSLTGYGLQASDAARVSEVLFTTAQRTQIPLQELESVIGRAGLTARALNLQFEEVAAIFLTLAQQGRRPAEAISLIEQIFNRLLNPTTQLQQILNEMGTPTAQLAIETFGLNGVLNRLNEIAEQSPERLGEITGSLRSLKAILGVTGDSVINIQGNVEALANSSGNLADAVNRVQADPAQQLRQEFQRISNVFTEDVGRRVIVTVVDLVNALGGIDSAVQDAVSAVRTLINVFVAYKSAVILSNIASAQFSINLGNTVSQFPKAVRQLGLLRGGLLTARTAANQLGSALARHPEIVAAGVALAISAYVELTNQLIQEHRRASEEVIRQNERIDEQTQRQLERQARERQAITDRQIQQAFAPQLSLVAEVSNLLNVRLNEIGATNKRIQDDFRVNSQVFLDTIRGNVSELSRAIQQTESDINTLRRRLASFQEQSQRRLFDLTLRFEEDPTNAIRLINQRKEQLEREIRDLFARGDRESVESARARFQELLQLAGRAQEQSVAIQRREFDRRVAAGLVQPETDITTGERRFVFRVNLNQAIQETLRLRRLEQDLEQQQLQILNRRLDALKAERADAEAGLRNTEAAIRTLSQFSAVTQTGELVKRFRDLELVQPGRGIAAARAEFEKLANEVRTTVTTEFNRLSEAARRATNIEDFQRLSAAAQEAGNRQLQIDAIINQARNNFETQLTAQRQRNIVSDAQQQITNARNVHAEQNRLNNQLIQESINRQREVSNNLVNQVQQISGALSFEGLTFNFQGTAANILGGVNSLASAITGIERIQTPFQRRLTAQLQTVSNAATQAQSTFADFNRSIQEGRPDVRLEQLLAQRVDNFIGLVNQLQAEAASDSRINDVLSTRIQSTGLTIRETIARIQQNLTDLRTSGQNLTQAQNNAQQLSGSLQNAANNIVGLNDGVVNIATQSGTISTNFAQVNQNLQTSLENIRAINLELSRTPRFNLGLLSFGPQQTAQIPGGYTGGLVNGPSGIDQVLMRATAGEFIVNARQTKRFYSQLVDINAGRIPKFQAGGRITTVGDINIVLSNERSESNVRDFAKKLNREIRRGNVDI